MVSLEQLQQIALSAEEIAASSNALQGSGGEDEQARSKALAATRKLMVALQDPAEAIIQHAFEGPERLCVRLAIDTRIFHTLANKASQPVSATELASACGVGRPLLVRILRVLVAIGFCGEADLESYIATPLTMAMTALPLEAAVKNTYDHAYQSFAKMPAYFRNFGFESPTDSTNGPFQFAMNTKLSFFDYMAQDPQVSKEFDTFMTASRRMKPHWADWFPVQQRLLDGFVESSKETSTLLVDVGGGYGQDLEYFNKKFPSFGHLVLQDLPRTIAEVKLSPEIEAMTYDFFTQQPIKNARAYFFHLVLHDWPDDKARDILFNTVAAMKPGYSKLILNEFILPDMACDLFPALADIHMMADLSGTERTEKQFRELLESIGLEDVKFWHPPSAGEGIVEATKRPSGTTNVPANELLFMSIHDLRVEESGDPGKASNCEAVGQDDRTYKIGAPYTHTWHHTSNPANLPWAAFASCGLEAFWRLTTGSHMASLLQEANYGVSAQSNALSFYNDVIVPCLGPAPSSEGLPHHFRSYCLDDYSPIEYSWCWDGLTGGDGARAPKIRFAFEAIGERAGTKEDPWNQEMTAEFVRTLKQKFKGHLDWRLFEYFWNTLLPKGESVRHEIERLAQPDSHRSSLFVACEMAGDEGELHEKSTAVKAYFMPMLRALQEGRSRTELLNDAIKDLSRTFHNLHFPALSTLIDYMTRPDTPNFEVEMLAVDCIELHQSRVKIYIRSLSTAWDIVSSVLTLNGRVSLPRSGLDNLRRLWKLVLSLDDYPDSHDLPLCSHSTGGSFFCFYAKASQALPSPKLYIPIKHYARSDFAAAKGLEAFLRTQDEASYTQRFWEVLKTIATHRCLDEGNGVQTYLSAQVRLDGSLSLTSYLGPEIYHKARWKA